MCLFKIKSYENNKAQLKETPNSFKKWPWNLWLISSKAILELGNITKAELRTITFFKAVLFNISHEKNINQKFLGFIQKYELHVSFKSYPKLKTLMEPFCYRKSYRLPCCNGSKAERTSTDACIFLRLFGAVSNLTWWKYVCWKATNVCFDWSNNCGYFFSCELVKFILTTLKRNISPLNV